LPSGSAGAGVGGGSSGGGGGGGGGDGEGDDGSRAVATLLSGSADFAVLPRPAFLIAVSQSSPVLAVANLLANDPVNLVVHSHIADARGLSAAAPLAERLDGMRGLRVGVAGGPVTRLRALFASVGMDADRDIEVVIVPGGQQNAWFAERRVDAIYAHTPYLETALTTQGGVLVVDQSAGEVPELAGRQIHLLVTSRELAARRPELVFAMTRAIHGAQELIHSDETATLAAIRSSGIRLQAPEALERIVEIYAPAVPEWPGVSAEGALRELALFPGRRAPPDLSSVVIEDFVDNRFALATILVE
jgi:ABC-type nitrate/sulfonate/bicarbonate transport system substrate-binding protein